VPEIYTEEVDYPTTMQEKREVADQILNTLKDIEPIKFKGMSGEVKYLKEQLAAAPYNMELILDLGHAYANDGQWDKACNVLLRGWKRAKEIDDPGRRTELLTILVEASYTCGKFKQALAVMNDIEEPHEPEALKLYEVMRCKICSVNGDMQKGLKSLSKAIEGDEFDAAASKWLHCLHALKRAGSYEESKGKVLQQATEDAQHAQETLDTLEKLADLRDAYHGTSTGQAAKPLLVRLLAGAVAACVIGALLFMLYRAERNNLIRLNFK